MPVTHLAVKFLSIEIKAGVAYYTISVTDLTTKETWIFQSRYSRMRQVHDSLNKIAKDSVPIFPPKRCCFNTEAAFVSQRQKALENYFNIVLKNGELAELQPLKYFLYLEKEAFSSKSSKEGKKGFGFLRNTATEERDFNNIYLGPKKSLGLKNAVDSFSFRFIDLALTLAPPEEEDIHRKKLAVMAHKWPKVSSVFFEECQQLPKGNEQNLIYLKEESFVKRSEEEIYHFEKIMRKIKEKSFEEFDLLPPTVLIYELQ